MISRHDEQEYLTSVEQLVVPTITRGLVMSTDDPLQCGRVQVWIPTLHGGAPDGIDVADLSDQLITESASTAADATSVGNIASASLSSNVGSLRVLPWATVLGYGWGPTGTPNGSTTNALTGMLAVPKPGTEVFLAFEQNDPDFPIVIGTVFHKTEALTLVPDKVTEIAPGIPFATNQSPEALTSANYVSNISDAFVVRSNKGKTLVLSDIPGKEEASLYSTTTYREGSTVNGLAYESFRSQYPVFPTTVTAARLVATPATNQSNIITFAEKTNVKSNSVRSYPFAIAAPPRSAGQEFLAPRDNGRRVHLGLDFSLPTGTPVLAPIAGTVLAIDTNTTGANGISVYLLGDDNSLHAFMHLSSIAAEIIAAINRGGTYRVAHHAEIAKSGNTGIPANGATYGSHLHWDVCLPGDAVNNRQEVFDVRSARRKGGTFKTKQFDANSFTHPEVWLRDGTNILVTPSQTRMFAESLLYDKTSNKYLGFVTTSTPGAESVVMRHPSGSYISIDTDGNINFFSVGDFNFKGNRSMNISLLGAFTMNCLAFFARAKAVFKIMSANLLQHGIWNASWSAWPTVLQKFVTAHIADANDMVRFSAANVKASYSYGPTAALTQVAGSYATAPLTTEKSIKLTTYDGLISKYYASVIASSTLPDTLKKELSVNILKGLMLHESNGDPNAVSRADAIGLFQLTAIAVRDVTGVTTAPENYKDPEENTKLAFQLLVKYANRLYTETNNQAVSAADIVNLALLAYNIGIARVSAYAAAVVKLGRTPTYAEVEHYMSTSNLQVAALTYVPTVRYISNKVRVASN